MQPLDCYFVGTESNHDVKLASLNELTRLLCCALLRQLFRLFLSEDFFQFRGEFSCLVFMSCNERPFGDLESYALDWLKLPPRRLELCAALKDFQGLYDLAPTNPANIANIGGGVIPRLCPLAELVSDMKGTLKDILKHTRRNLKVVMPVISPYLGGIDAAELDSSSADKGRECTQLKVAVFNPGRTGLIALSTEEILWWRLGHISCVLLEQDVQICVLPGARWPPGASLPPAIAYAWLGAQTTSWRSVALSCGFRRFRFRCDTLGCGA